jgi:hypothetical protein
MIQLFESRTALIERRHRDTFFPTEGNYTLAATLEPALLLLKHGITTAAY